MKKIIFSLVILFCSISLGQGWNNTVTIGLDYNARSYYLKCKYEDPHDQEQETNPTNTVEVRLAAPLKQSFNISSISQSLEYKLEQNYPNPFNPVTTINFTLPKNNFTTFKVYDILGREIATLVNEIKESGTYSVIFNAERLPSGIYIYQIKSGNYIETRKMILNK